MLHRDPRSGLWVPSARLYMPGTWAPGAGRRIGPIAVQDLGDATSGTGSSTTTFTFGSFGSASYDRRLVALIVARDDAAAYTCTGVTIGGVSATVHADAGGVSQQVSAVIASAIVPSGASGNVVATWSEALANVCGCTLILLTGTGVGSAAASANQTTNNNSGTSTIGTTISCPARGIVLGAAACTGNPMSLSSFGILTNVTSDATLTGNTRAASAYQIFPTVQSGVTVTATWSATSSNKALALASFAEG